MARATSRAERRGGPISRGAPSVLPMRLSHRPPGASAAATWAAKRARSSGSSKTWKSPGQKRIGRGPRAARRRESPGFGNGNRDHGHPTSPWLFDRERGDIDAKDLEAALRQPKRIGPRPRADLQRPRRPNATRGDELDQQRLRLPRDPGKLSRGVALIPGTMRHHATSLAYGTRTKQNGDVDTSGRRDQTIVHNDGHALAFSCIVEPKG
jgi:hypothetical protein